MLDRHENMPGNAHLLFIQQNKFLFSCQLSEIDMLNIFIIDTIMLLGCRDYLVPVWRGIFF
jgi:hypothetical protein